MPANRKPPPLEDRIRQLRASVSEAQAKKAKAEHELGVAEARRDEALAVLSTEFGVTDIAAVRELLAQAEADLAAECESVEQALEAAG